MSPRALRHEIGRLLITGFRGHSLPTEVRALARECAAQGYRRIDLNVLDWNPARGFYEKLGFKWIKNWLPYRLSGEALENLAG